MQEQTWFIRLPGPLRELDRRQENNVLASSGLQTPDGGLIVLATILHFPDNDGDIQLLKVDENGNEVWPHTWEQGWAD